MSKHGSYAAHPSISIDVSEISDDWKQSILDLVDYCNRKGVKITLYDSPISSFMLSRIGNYDEYIGFIRELIHDKNVTFAEFNLLKEDYYAAEEPYYFDDHHLNLTGAEAFSNFLADYMKGAVPASAYYGSIREKLAELVPDYYDMDKEASNVRRIRLISNRPRLF